VSECDHEASKTWPTRGLSRHGGGGQQHTSYRFVRNVSAVRR
jgi:hypothetical protein